MRKEKYLVFTGFVSGYGGIAKARRFITGLRERGINPLIVTEENYRGKLVQFDLSPDITIPRRAKTEDNYAEVAHGLDTVDYEMMISFGPRSFGPKHAADTGRRAVIVDGGLPPFLGGDDTDHDREVYQSLESYILTCHFPWNPPSDVLSGYSGIQVKVLSQPTDGPTRSALADYKSLTEHEIATRRNSFCLRFGKEYKGEPILPVRMSSSLLDKKNLEENGGWLQQREFDEVTSFLEHFIMTLGSAGVRVTVPINAKIAYRFESLLNDYPDITVLPLPFLPPEQCLELSRIAHLNIERAMRDVTQFEIAASGSYGIVCPCPTNYMHEDIAAEEADRRGIIKHIPITTPNLGHCLLDYIGSDHYHTSRERRVSLWEEMDLTRNIIEGIVGRKKTRRRSRTEDYRRDEVGDFLWS